MRGGGGGKQELKGSLQVTVVCMLHDWHMYFKGGEGHGEGRGAETDRRTCNTYVGSKFA